MIFDYVLDDALIFMLLRLGVILINQRSFPEIGRAHV